jgi:hypothetical protein
MIASWPSRHHLAALLVLLARLLYRLPVEAFVVDELAVFRGDDGALQVGGNAPVVNPLVPEDGLGVLLAKPVEARGHERGHVGIVVAPPPDARCVGELPGEQRDDERRA